MNGPEPIWVWVLLSGSVSATLFGIMKGTCDDGLPSESSTRPYGSFRIIWKVLASTALKSFTKSMSFWPMASRAPQRLIEAMQSSEVTGLPSCHSSPSRRVKVHSVFSGETSYLSTICGFDPIVFSGGKQVWLREEA